METPYHFLGYHATLEKNLKMLPTDFGVIFRGAQALSEKTFVNVHNQIFVHGSYCWPVANVQHFNSVQRVTLEALVNTRV